MSSDIQRALVHPFVSGLLDPPRADRHVLVIGATQGLQLPADFAARTVLIQGFRPYFRTLQAAGWDVQVRTHGSGYDVILVELGRHRGQNESRLGEALRLARPGGLVVAAGGKLDGATSLYKRVSAILPACGHLSKYHCTVFWFERPCRLPDLSQVLQAGEPDMIEGRFHTAPGMFSHRAVDTGSRLLVETLPDKITGEVADFCAGWGYVAATIAERHHTLARLDLYEADHDSLQAARLNIRARATPVGYFWQDLLNEPAVRCYDLIVMNPPFHIARRADPGIGKGLLQAAAQALKPRGQLFLVANQGLPYEQTLRHNFRDVREQRRAEGFKVMSARR